MGAGGEEGSMGSVSTLWLGLLLMLLLFLMLRMMLVYGIEIVVVELLQGRIELVNDR